MISGILTLLGSFGTIISTLLKLHNSPEMRANAGAATDQGIAAKAATDASSSSDAFDKAVQ